MTAGSDLVWRAITRLFDDMGYPPTLAEIAQACAYTRTGIMGHLGRLEALGIIERHTYRARGLRLLKRHPDIPLPPSPDDN